MPPTPPPSGPGSRPFPSIENINNMPNPNMRPRDVFELIREGFSTVKDVLPTFVIIIALIAFFKTFVEQYLFSPYTSNGPEGLTTAPGSEPIINPLSLVTEFTPDLVISFMLEFLAKLLFSAFMASFVYMSYYRQKYNQSISLGEAFQQVKPFLTTFIVLDFLLDFLIRLGLGFFLIPGLFFAVWWAMALPILFDEKSGVFDSMSRSKNLVQGFKWHILGYIIAINLLQLVLSSLVSGAIIVNAISVKQTALPGGGFTVEPTISNPGLYFFGLFMGSFLTFFINGIDYIIRPILYMDVLARQEQHRFLMMQPMPYGMVPPPVGYPGTGQPMQPQAPSAPPAGPSYQYPPPSTIGSSTIVGPEPSAIRACQNCGSPLEMNARFCPNCGAPVQVTPQSPSTPPEETGTSLVCKSCGHENPGDALFCENCGSRLR